MDGEVKHLSVPKPGTAWSTNLEGKLTSKLVGKVLWGGSRGSLNLKGIIPVGNPA